jgi:hypothetical protein
MNERSCTVPLLVRLRGEPDEGDLAEMRETIARTVAGRLSEAASVITAREGWDSYRETHTLPTVSFNGGSLDANLQRRVAAAIEAGIARAVSSRSGAVTGLAPPLRPVGSRDQAAAPIAGLRLDPQETETDWYLNGIRVFKIQRPGGGAGDCHLDFQPVLSISGDGRAKLQITVFRDANVIVLLQPDAVSQLTHLASEIEIRDVVTVAHSEARPPGLGASVSVPTSQATAMPERSIGPSSPPSREEFQQSVDVPSPPPPSGSLYLQSDASPPLASPGSESANLEGLPPRLTPNQSIDLRTTERNDFDEQRHSLGRDWRSGGGAIPQSLDAPSSSEPYDFRVAFVKSATDDQLLQFAGTPEGRRVLDSLFDEFTSGDVSEEEQKQADRILVLKTKALMTEEEFAAGVERAQGDDGIILPYKKTGSLGSEASPIYVSRRPGGRVWVHLRGDIFASHYALDPDVRLPPSIGQGVELNEMDVIGVKFLDDGGVVSFFPALFLMQLGNEVTRVVLAKAREPLAADLTTGVATEAVSAGGAEAIRTEHRVDAAAGSGFAWADRIALDLDLVSSRIRAHRSWIIETWPDTGRAFVEAMEQLIDYTRVHGLTQGGSRFVQFGNSLQKGYQEWRATVDAVKSRLSETDRETIEQIGKDTEELLQAINTAQQEVPPSSETAATSEHPAKTRSEEPGVAPATDARV